jgi:hypothetical protein
MPNAAIAKIARHAAAPLLLTAPCGLRRAGERIGFISVPQSLVFEKALYAKNSVRRHPIKIATIHLQGNRKPKMMPRAKFIRRLVQDFTSVEAAAPATTKRIYSNDQHVDTCRNIWSIDDRGDFCG